MNHPLIAIPSAQSLFGEQDWRTVYYDTPKKELRLCGQTGKIGGVCRGIVDFNDRTAHRVNEQGQQIFSSPLYFRKPCTDAFSISFAVIVLPLLIAYSLLTGPLDFLPPWVKITIVAVGLLSIASMAYHLVRIPIISLYIIGHALYSIAKEMGRKAVIATAVCLAALALLYVYAPTYCAFFGGLLGVGAVIGIIKNKKIQQILSSHAVALVKQIWVSLVSIIKAPFYALLYNLGHLMVVCGAPSRGRKFAAKWEQSWNRNIPLEEGFSLAGLAERRWKFEGGGAIENLGQTAFYLTRCYNPQALALFTVNAEGVITYLGVESMSGGKLFPPAKETDNEGRPIAPTAKIEGRHCRFAPAGWVC